MSTRNDRKLPIPYGAAQLPAGWLSRSDSGEVACSVAHVIVDAVAREPLRLNDGQYEFAAPPPLAELGEPLAQLDFLKRDMRRRCDLWNKRQKQFLDCYFGFVAGHVEDNRDSLLQSIAAFGTLYRYADWMFSAPRPLPRAHLHAPANRGAALYDPASMIGVDFAFWTGGGLLAIDVIGSETRGPRDKARHERLQGAGIALVEMPQSALLDSQAFAKLLPAFFHRFWEGQALPRGPFGTTALSDFEPG